MSTRVGQRRSAPSIVRVESAVGRPRRSSRGSPTDIRWRAAGTVQDDVALRQLRPLTEKLGRPRQPDDVVRDDRALLEGHRRVAGHEPDRPVHALRRPCFPGEDRVVLDHDVAGDVAGATEIDGDVRLDAGNERVRGQEQVVADDDVPRPGQEVQLATAGDLVEAETVPLDQEPVASLDLDQVLVVALVRVAAAGAEERPVEAVAADDHVRPEPAAEKVAAAAVVEVVVDDAEPVRAAGQEARRQLAAVGEVTPADRHRVGPVEPQGCPHPRTAADANAVDDDVSRAGDLESRRHSDREDPEPDEPDGPCALEPQVADRGAVPRADRQRSRAARPDDELVVAAGPEDDRAAAGPELLHGGCERALRRNDAGRRPRVGRPRRHHRETAGEGRAKSLEAHARGLHHREDRAAGGVNRLSGQVVLRVRLYS